MVIGPVAGTAPDERRRPRSPCRSSTAATPSRRSGSGAPSRRRSSPTLERAAALLAPYCLVGWDTGGEEWVP